MRRTCLPSLILALGLSAQGVEFTGRVMDSAGQPVARARITFRVLETRSRLLRGLRGVYDRAQRQHADNIALPVTVTDRDGQWRIVLGATRASLFQVSALQYVMQVDAKGFEPFRRAIGNDLRQASQTAAVLEKAHAQSVLDLRLEGLPPPYRGYVLIERPFRVLGRTTWLQDLLPIETDGSLRFAGAPRISGESPATSPTAREEGYRLRFYIAGAESLTTYLSPGTQVVNLKTNAWSSRKVLADRAAPAKLPIRATYALCDRELTLDFNTAAVPMLGDEVPIRITTGSGPVELDTWDPDLPLFVVLDAKAPARDTQPAVEFGTQGQLDLIVTDRKKVPVRSAGVWLENNAVKRTRPGTIVYGTTDANGHLHLDGLPVGTYRVLVQHPEHGRREVVVALNPAAKTVQVRLKTNPTVQPPRVSRSGTLLIDLGKREPETEIEIGILSDAGVLSRRRFADRPRFLRLEGLIVGPVTFYLRIGKTAHFFAGTIAGGYEQATLMLADCKTQRFTLHIHKPKGSPATAPTVSLGESTRKGKPAPTASLFELTPQQGRPGHFELEVAVQGNLWLQIQEGDSHRAEISVANEQANTTIDVTLRRFATDDKKDE